MAVFSTSADDADMCLFCYRQAFTRNRPVKKLGRSLDEVLLSFFTDQARAAHHRSNMLTSIGLEAFKAEGRKKLREWRAKNG